jgi:hypothetical protein
VTWFRWHKNIAYRWRNYSTLIELNAWPINRPHCSFDWYDENECGIAFAWSNGNSDPVFCLTITARRGSLIHRLAERRWQRQVQREDVPA